MYFVSEIVPTCHYLIRYCSSDIKKLQILDLQFWIFKSSSWSINFYRNFKWWAFMISWKFLLGVYQFSCDMICYVKDIDMQFLKCTILGNWKFKLQMLPEFSNGRSKSHINANVQSFEKNVDKKNKTVILLLRKGLHATLQLFYIYLGSNFPIGSSFFTSFS